MKNVSHRGHGGMKPVGLSMSGIRFALYPLKVFTFGGIHFALYEFPGGIYSVTIGWERSAAFSSVPSVAKKAVQ